MNLSYIIYLCHIYITIAFINLQQKKRSEYLTTSLFEISIKKYKAY